nr:unnamed protein product [Callosobruchus chinensis]
MYDRNRNQKKEQFSQYLSKELCPEEVKSDIANNADVKCSEGANSKPLHVWCLITKDGSVSTAHCTCLAGNCEACNHIGAVLFTAENANRKRGHQQEGTSCTDVLTECSQPSSFSQVPIVPVRDMNWGTTSGDQNNQNIPAMTHAELVNMLKDISDLGYSSALHTIVKPFASKIWK